jgi:ribosomal protein S18 acetylase RimI-like enzyme
MNIKFSRATPGELEEALEFFKLASQSLSEKNVSQWNYWTDPPADKIEWVKQGFDKGEFFFVYNESDDKIAMFRLLKNDSLYWEEKGLEDNVRYVHSLVVPSVFAGLGIGKAVMLKIIEGLKTEGVKKFRLDCDGSNPRLCNYYESYGFEKVGEKTTNYAINNLYELSL